MKRNVDASTYRLDFFKRHNFLRKRCKVCGDFFWTINPELETCMDAPCSDYVFPEIKIRSNPLSVREVRKKFIDFFKRHGHEPVEPRPVVARWRDDLYLTIASIVVFQPFVTNGIVPPPANPLVISQPCIRLEDIDNVGITFGRHLTSFEMAAHHAFNYPDKKVYWKDKTVELAYEFFTKEIGVPEDQIVFKESWWEGGGNAGPSFEVTVGGLEVATLVFMQYKVEGDKYVEIPIKIVDTGYGVERIAWLTQKTPTAFHAIYGRLVDEFYKKLGVEPLSNEELMVGLKYASKLDPNNPKSIDGFIERVSKELSVNKNEFKELFTKTAKVYAILDHTRTLAWMLADGIVPSNSGEGYLARLVIRRTLRSMNTIGADVPLSELVLLQIKYWSDDFPRLKKRIHYIIDVINHEENKFKETLKRGMNIIKRYIKKKRKLGLNELIELYDSHGLPPDIVAQKARELGIEVEVPPNFYALVAARHGGAVAREVKSKIPKDIVEWVRRLPETRRLFHEDPYIREFKAKIVGLNDKYLVLDATAFYPEGGGQKPDTGYIIFNSNKVRVIDVQKVDGVILHVLEKPIEVNNGEVVIGRIDWDRRFKIMRHHTATHILLGALRRVLGEHIWQAGAEKTEEKARLDVTHYKMPSSEELRKIEELVNKVITERRRVITRFVERNRAEALYGYTIYQGGVPPDPVLRIVEIEDWDTEACFGTHVSVTSEIGGIKIISVDKLQDGVIRFEYVAGTQLVDYTSRLEETLDNIASLIGASRKDLDKRIRSLIEAYNRIREENSFMKRKIISTILNEVAKNAEKTTRGIKYYIIDFGEYPESLVREIMQYIYKQIDDILLISVKEKGRRVQLEISVPNKLKNRINAIVIINELKKKLKVKGGGKPEHVIAVVEESKNKLLELLNEILESL